MKIKQSITDHIGRRLRRSLPILLIISASALIALTQQGVVDPAPSIDRLREHIEYLASDVLEGRRTGSAGANNAAHYIAGEFQRLGLRPGTPLARPSRMHGAMLAQYEQRFPYVAGVELGKGNTLTVNGGSAAGDFKVGKDWMPLGFSANGAFQNAEDVFVGYGITASELKYDSYGPVARDRVAIALSGTPDGDNPRRPDRKYPRHRQGDSCPHRHLPLARHNRRRAARCMPPGGRPGSAGTRCLGRAAADGQRDRDHARCRRAGHRRDPRGRLVVPVLQPARRPQPG